MVEGKTDDVNDSAGVAAKKFSINFRKENTKFCLGLDCNDYNSYLFVNGEEICKFKADNKHFLT